MAEKKESVYKNMAISKVTTSAGKKSEKYQVNIPSKWAKELGIEEDDKKIKLVFDGTKIIIKKV